MGKKIFGTFDIKIGDKSISLKDQHKFYICAESTGTFTGDEVAMIVSDIIQARNARERMGFYSHLKEENNDDEN